MTSSAACRRGCATGRRDRLAALPRRAQPALHGQGPAPGADLVILDESFAALDPETLQRCLRCVPNRAATVLVIAHP